MTESRKYWRDREEWQRQKNITAEAAYNAEIEKIHKRMIKDIQDKINAFYTRYADSEGLTLAEAKKRSLRLMWRLLAIERQGMSRTGNFPKGQMRS